MKNTKNQKKKDPYAKQREYLAERKKAIEKKYGKYEPTPISEEEFQKIINQEKYKYIKDLILMVR